MSVRQADEPHVVLLQFSTFFSIQLDTAHALSAVMHGRLLRRKGRGR